MAKKWVLTLAGLALVLATVFIIKSKQEAVSPETESAAPNAQSNNDTVSAPNADTTAPLTAPAPQAETNSNVAPPVNFPKIEDVRKQVEADPHSTPMILIKLSQDMATNMEKSNEKKEYATSFFAHLEKCADDESLPSVQSVCIVNAHTLSTQYPEFKDRYQKMFDGLPEQTRALLSIVGKN